MEHELKQRENMLTMFQYSKDQRDKDLSSLPYYQLGFGSQSLPGGQKVHELVAAQNMAPLNKEAFQINNSSMHRNNLSNSSTPFRASQIYPQNIAASSGGFQFLGGAQQDVDERPPPRFDYSTYMQNLQQKLAEHHPAAANWAHPVLPS